MKIGFISEKLKKTLNDEKKLKKEYGLQNAKKIMIRLATLEASNTLADVRTSPPERLHPLHNIGKKRYKGHFAVDLDKGFRMIFVPDHDPIPRREDDSIDLKKVTRIMIVEISDYH